MFIKLIKQSNLAKMKLKLDLVKQKSLKSLIFFMNIKFIRKLAKVNIFWFL